jgi:hypothetical protein
MVSANMDFYITGATKLELQQTTQESLCLYKTKKKEILSIVQQLISEHFPNLVEDYKDNRIALREFENDSYFLKTFFKLGHILKDKRVYYLDINKKLYDCAPPKNALIAILAHELKHIDDYKDANSMQLIKLGIKMARKKTRSQYERKTDYFVMEKGMAEGIREYRYWIYKKLSENALKKKKCYYYTPEEINQYLQGETNFSDYFAKYCKR